MTTTRAPILRSLPDAQAEIVIAAYAEQGIHFSSVDYRHQRVLINLGFLISDVEGFLMPTRAVQKSLDRLRGKRTNG